MKNLNRSSFLYIAYFFLFTLMLSCGGEDFDDRGEFSDINDDNPIEELKPVFLVLDEESIDAGSEPNNFTSQDINKNISRIGLRESLPIFRNNTGKEIVLYSGQVGDEGWFSIKNIPASWGGAGTSSSGARNFLNASPGLGGNGDDSLLDETRDVIPLRATGLAMLTGQTVIAIVYDSDISINYDPIQGNLLGENLGVVAFEVLEVTSRSDGSDSTLPAVRILIKNVEELKEEPLYLFSNSPVPQSSSQPFDVNVPASVPAIQLTPSE